MTPRLPIPGADSDTWGEILNDFLSVSHHDDGALKPEAVTTTALQDSSVSGEKLQDTSISSMKLDAGPGVDGQVLSYDSSAPSGLSWASSSLADDSVSNAKLQANSVSTSKLQDTSVSSAKIQDGAISSTKIQNSSISSAKLNTGSGTDGQALILNSAAAGGLAWADTLSDNSVSTAKLQDSAVTNTKLQDNSVSTTKLQDTSVSNAKLQDSAVSSAKLQNNSITGAKLNTGTGTDGQYLTLNSGASGGISWATPVKTLRFSLTSFFKSNTLTTTTGTSRLPIDGTYTIVGTRLMVGTAPTGSSIIIDVKKNGTTIYSTQANRPTIAATQTSGGPGATPDVTTLAAGDYLTVDIIQVGSTIAGADLTVSVGVDKVI